MLARLAWLVPLVASWLLAAPGETGWSQTAPLPAPPPVASTPGGAASDALPTQSRPPHARGSTLGPLSAKLATDCRAAGGDWPAGWTFFEGALVASGVEDAHELARWISEYAPRRDQIVQAVLQEPVDNRPARLHALLHASILKGPYVRSASDLRLALRHGSYNCLTSVAFFWDLGQAAGMRLEIWTRPGHAYLRLHTDRGPVLWEPGAPPESGALIASFAVAGTSVATSFPPISPDVGHGPTSLPTPSRALTPRQLLGRFYYNRAVERLQAGQYTSALDLLSMSLTLDPTDADARQNYLAGLNNWAVASWRRGEASLAAQLIHQGLRLDPTYGPLRANQRLLERKF